MWKQNRYTLYCHWNDPNRAAVSRYKLNSCPMYWASQSQLAIFQQRAKRSRLSSVFQRCSSCLLECPSNCELLFVLWSLCHSHRYLAMDAFLTSTRSQDQLDWLVLFGRWQRWREWDSGRRENPSGKGNNIWTCKKMLAWCLRPQARRAWVSAPLW